MKEITKEVKDAIIRECGIYKDTLIREGLPEKYFNLFLKRGAWKRTIFFNTMHGHAWTYIAEFKNPNYTIGMSARIYTSFEEKIESLALKIYKLDLPICEKEDTRFNRILDILEKEES